MEETQSTVTELEIKPETIEQSSAFIGKWNTLISTTNWEKGAIIIQWRQSLKEDGAPASQYSDDAWSRMVGGVTSQHVGRLRRTSDRFGDAYDQFEGLYWSHFFAALDWDDAEMWLEGAIQNKWSVSQMRNQRWETMGSVPAEQPKSEEIVVSEADEEDQTITMSDNLVSASDSEYVGGPAPEGPDFGDEPKGERKSRDESDDDDSEMVSELAADETTGKPIRLFESFKDLPDDIQSAADLFKVAIIRHKAAGWEEISQYDLLDLLGALGHLAQTEI